MPVTRIRPGFVVRDILLGRQLILPDNDVGIQASPTDLFRTYKILVRDARGAGATLQRGMSRHSFSGLLYQARRLGLMVQVGEEPSVVPEPPRARANLLNIDTNFPGIVNSSMGFATSMYTVVNARRVLYQIGDDGAGASPAWGNIPAYYTRLIDTLKGR